MVRSNIFISIVAVFQFISMAFLIICCVTAPVFKQIGLSKYNHVTYGVFGYCNKKGCSEASSSYNPYELTGKHAAKDWKISDKGRQVLGRILIVTPIAAGLNFFSFLSSFISVIIVTLQKNTNTFSAILFFVNLIFTVCGFLSAALMCIVIFLLFYPHMTWCSWLLIPAAVLPLINIPIIFFGYSSNKNNNNNNHNVDMTNLDYTDDENHLLDQEFIDNQDNTNFARNTILPEFQPQNTDLSHKNTFGTISTTDISSNPYLDKKDEYYIATTEKDSNTNLSNTTNSNNHTLLNEKNEHDNDEELDNEIDDRRESFVAFSAIDNDADINKTNPPSLNSSSFSHKDLNENQQPTNRLLHDIYNDQSNIGNGNLANIHQKNISVDERSDFTSISQRPANPNYYPPQNNNNNNRVGQPLPYPHSPMVSSPAYTPQPPQHSNLQTQQYQPQPQQMNQHVQLQQGVPQRYQQNQMPLAGPDPSELLLQNNPNFIPQTRNMGPKKRFGNMNNSTMPMMPNNNSNMNRGPNHFQNAYKRRMADRSNIYNNLHSQQNNPYEFR